MLLQWPRIYTRLERNATLTVLYGFTPGFLSSLPNTTHSQRWLESMARLLQQPGVQYIGHVNHTELARHYAASGFFLYPTSFPETGCIAAMKVRRNHTTLIP